MKETVLVTGGAGYIGSHTCKALAQAGYLPVVYDNLSTGHSYAVKWGPFVQGDLNDKERLQKVFKDFQPKAVIHFAASALVMESMVDPGKYYRNNVGSTIALLEAMEMASVKTIVFSSTCASYGNPKKMPITEKEPQMPINPYGRSKWMIEQILADFEMAHSFQFATLRYFNACGADFDLEIGENHNPETHLIPTLIQTALGLRKDVVIYGTDFASCDGSAVRDYVHVVDLARAHILALQWLFANQKSISLNLGTGRGCSVIEILNAVQKICGKPVAHRFEKARAGEPGVLTADNSLAKQILNWSPEYSDLPTIIESAWRWHKHLFASSSVFEPAFS